MSVLTKYEDEIFFRCPRTRTDEIQTPSQDGKQWICTLCKQVHYKVPQTS